MANTLLVAQALIEVAYARSDNLLVAQNLIEVAYARSDNFLVAQSLVEIAYEVWAMKEGCKVQILTS